MTSTPTRSSGAPRTQTILLATALTLWSVPALAQARPERMSDKDVKALIDQVDTGREIRRQPRRSVQGIDTPGGRLVR